MNMNILENLVMLMLDVYFNSLVIMQKTRLEARWTMDGIRKLLRSYIIYKGAFLRGVVGLQPLPFLAEKVICPVFIIYHTIALMSQLETQIFMPHFYHTALALKIS